MLTITVPERELFNEATLEFINVKRQTLQLEHSLVSLAKWESKWCKPFLGREPHSHEELTDYVRCMTITQNVDPNVYFALTPKNIDDIKAYMDHPMTATWFSREKGSKKDNTVVTAEILYYLMVAFQIPFECQKWHLNRLITLIRVCEAKNAKPEKPSQRDLISKYKQMNEARRKAWGTKG